MNMKMLTWVKQYQEGTVERWKKVIFSDVSPFEVQGQ